MKHVIPPMLLLYPTPVVFVTSQDTTRKPNIIPIAAIGIACAEPPMVSVGIKKNRHSHELIKSSKDFVVNIPTLDFVEISNRMGKVSGREHDKFALMGLSVAPATQVKAPLIQECPVNLECVLRKVVPLGSHDLFIGEIVQVHIDESLIKSDNRFNFTDARPMAYALGEYWSLGQIMGESEFSIDRLKKGLANK